jgi:hypothetical protein
MGDDCVEAPAFEERAEERNNLFRFGRVGEQASVRPDVWIAEGEEGDGGEAQRVRGATELSFPDRAQLVARAEGRIARLAALAAGCAQQVDFGTGARQCKKSGAGKHCFVVRVGDYAGDAQRSTSMDIAGKRITLPGPGKAAP